MFDRLKKLYNTPVLRYIAIGGLSYVAEITILLYFIYSLRVDSVISVAVSFWIGLTLSFLLQKFIAFKNNQVVSKLFIRQMLYYALLIIFNYLFTVGFVYVTESLLGVFAARTIALIITTAWNFIAYSKLIFKQR